MADSADVVVIGGGPAGCTAATLLKKAMPGWRIVICEREQFPRHHIGESLLPNANPVLAKIGVVDKLDAAGFLRKGGVTVKLREGHPMIREWFILDEKRYLQGAPDQTAIPDHAWQVERSQYDKILLDHASDAGVEVVERASAVGVLGDASRVTGVVVNDDEGRRSISTRFLIDCSGQARFVGRALALDMVEHDLGDLAIYRYYDGADWSEDYLGSPSYSKVFFSVAPPVGWIWYIVLSPTRVSVGVVTRKNVVAGRDIDEVFDETLARVPEMSSLLRNARRSPATGESEPTTRTHTAANWSYAHSRIAGPGWYLAGDAAAFVDPVLSSGVMLAHYAGLWVANAIMTECDHPEVSSELLYRTYSEVYEDARAGFGDMASWWYSQSDENMNETWVEHGAKLMHSRHVRGAEGMSDVEAFMSLVAGRLTDFRFRHVGMGGFEPKGMADVGGGSYGTDLVDTVLSAFDPSCEVLRSWDRVERDWYLGTYVEANYWWRLPMLRFFCDGEPVEYRPVVHFLDNGDPDVGKSVTVLDTMLAALETSEVFGDVEGELERRLIATRGETVEARMTHEMIQDLNRLELLKAGAAGGIPRPRIDRPLGARDGRRTLGDIVDAVRESVRRSDGGFEDAANAMLSELVHLKVLDVVAQSDGRRSLPADAQAMLTEAIVDATKANWTLDEAYGRKGTVSVLLTLPGGSLILEMTSAARVPQAYKTLNGMSYWYRNVDGAPPPSGETLVCLDRIIAAVGPSLPALIRDLLADGTD